MERRPSRLEDDRCPKISPLQLCRDRRLCRLLAYLWIAPANSLAISQISLPADPTLTAQTSVVRAAMPQSVREKRLIYRQTARETPRRNCVRVAPFLDAQILLLGSRDESCRDTALAGRCRDRRGVSEWRRRPGVGSRQAAACCLQLQPSRRERSSRSG